MKINSDINKTDKIIFGKALSEKIEQAIANGHTQGEFIRLLAKEAGASFETCKVNVTRWKAGSVLPSKEEYIKAFEKLLGIPSDFTRSPRKYREQARDYTLPVLYFASNEKDRQNAKDARNFELSFVIDLYRDDQQAFLEWYNRKKEYLKACERAILTALHTDYWVYSQSNEKPRGYDSLQDVLNETRGFLGDLDDLVYSLELYEEPPEMASVQDKRNYLKASLFVNSELFDDSEIEKMFSERVAFLEKETARLKREMGV